jgi:hypothetical protein
MKKEAAAFLQYLMTHDDENLPGEFRRDDVAERALESI